MAELPLHSAQSDTPARISSVQGYLIIETYMAMYGTLEVCPEPIDFRWNEQQEQWEAGYTLPENHQIVVSVKTDDSTGEVTYSVSDGGAFQVTDTGLRFVLEPLA